MPSKLKAAQCTKITSGGLRCSNRTRNPDWDCGRHPVDAPSVFAVPVTVDGAVIPATNQEDDPRWKNLNDAAKTIRSLYHEWPSESEQAIFISKALNALTSARARGTQPLMYNSNQ